MRATQMRKDEAQARPDEHGERQDQQQDGPRRCVFRAPEVRPITSGRGGKEEILQDNGEVEPQYDAPTQDAAIERGRAARSLAVVGWQANPQAEADGPEEECDRHGDGGYRPGPAVRDD